MRWRKDTRKDRGSARDLGTLHEISVPDGPPATLDFQKNSLVYSVDPATPNLEDVIKHQVFVNLDERIKTAIKFGHETVKQFERLAPNPIEWESYIQEYMRQYREAMDTRACLPPHRCKYKFSHRFRKFGGNESVYVFRCEACDRHVGVDSQRFWGKSQ